MKKQTISDILKADDIRSVLCELNEMSDEIETITAVIRRSDDVAYCRYFGSVPETIGLLDIGRQLVSREIVPDREGLQ